MSDAPAMYDAPIGPSYYVPKEQYNLLKQHILGKRKKPAASKKKKTASKKKSRSGYRRYYRSGGTLGGMGPIVITGRGGYFTDKLAQGASAAWRGLKRLTPEGTFSRLGQAAGGAMFGRPGASLGAALGSGVSSVLGFGDYAIRRNDLLQLNEGTPVPTFADLNQGIVVCHREYIGDITQTTNFTNNAFSIQPGDSTTFPWLSILASQFEQYEMLGCLFQFRSTASDFGTTSNMAMGTVILATEYDTVDNLYGSKLEMENAQYSMSGKPSQDMIHPVECDPSLVGPNGLKYVRSGPVPAGKDIRLYDHGTFQLATTGMPVNGGVIGELWVTYKIAFYKPQFNLGTNIKTDYYASTTATTSSYWGSNAVRSANSSLGTVVTNNVLTFPENTPIGASYVITYWVAGANAALSGVMAISATNGVVTKMWSGNAPGNGAVSSFIAIVKKTAPAFTITITAGALPVSVTECKVVVSQIDVEVASDVV